MSREMRCQMDNGSQVEDLWCESNDKPARVMNCTDTAECIKYQKYGFLDSATGGALHYSNWSRCSVKCGPGLRTRTVSCRSLINPDQQLPTEYCDVSKIDKLKMRCNLANCSYKLIEKWSPVN